MKMCAFWDDMTGESEGRVEEAPKHANLYLSS